MALLSVLLGGCLQTVVGRAFQAEEGPGAFMVTGAAKCGICAMNPFAIPSTPGVGSALPGRYCWQGGLEANGEQCDPANFHRVMSNGWSDIWSTPFSITDPQTGANTVIHCIGPQDRNLATGQISAHGASNTESFVTISWGRRSPGRVVPETLDECLLTNDALADWGANSFPLYPWEGVGDGTRQSWCQAAPIAGAGNLVQLNFNTPAQFSPIFGQLPAVNRPANLAAFFGPKLAPSANPKLCITAPDSPSRTAEGARMLNALTSIYSHRGLAGRLPPVGPPTRASINDTHPATRYCFIDRQSVTYARDFANNVQMCELPPDLVPGFPAQDPGLLVGGVPLAVNNTSTIELWSGGNLLTTANVTGTAAGYYRLSTFALTELELTQVAAVTASGHAITAGYANIANYWTGTLSGTGALAVPAGAANMFVWFRDNGNPLQQTITSTTVLTGTRAGTSTTLHGEFVEGALRFVINLSMTDSAVRPTATINTLTNTLTGQPVVGSDLECHRDSSRGAGISITATGTVTNGTPSWAVESPIRPNYRWSGVNTITEFVPLDPPAFAGSSVVLSAWQSGMLTQASREVRATDTTAPSISGTAISPSCAWGRTLPGSYGPQLAQCAAIIGNFTDNCDDHPHAEILSVHIYAWPSGQLLEARPTQSGNCLQVYAGATDAQLSNVDYVVDYVARDSWTNSSTVRHWKGYFSAASATTTCSHPTIAVTESDN